MELRSVDASLAVFLAGNGFETFAIGHESLLFGANLNSICSRRYASNVIKTASDNYIKKSVLTRTGSGTHLAPVAAPAVCRRVATGAVSG